MSLSYQRLNAVTVRDPRTIIHPTRDYAVLKCGEQTTWKAWTSTSISTGSCQFSCPPPSAEVFMDSKIYFYLPIRLTMTGVPPVGQQLLKPGFSAPRAYPISGSIETLTATINNQSVSINLSDIIHPMSWYNTDDALLDGDYSTFPNYPDQSQQYADLTGAVRNPLGGYADVPDGAKLPRGAYPFAIVSNPVQAVTGATVTAVVDVFFCEPLILPPLYNGSSNRQAFYNVNAFDLNITFLNSAARYWSHNDEGGTNPINSISVGFGGTIAGPQTVFPTGNLPLIFIQYITPQESQRAELRPDMPLTYPYFDIQRYPTAQSPALPGISTRMSNNNVQLSSIPRRIYLYVRPSNQELMNNPNLTDTYFAIENISLQFMNKNGLLASANQEQLYLMCRKNHCGMNWTQWSGGPSNSTGVGGPLRVSTVGSVVCIEFATDIGLGSELAPGALGQFQINVDITARNLSERTINPTFYMVAVLEGTFTIIGRGQAMREIGVLSQQDVLASQSKPEYSYADVEAVQGGDFMSGLKSFFTNKVLPQLKNFVDNRGISTTLGMIPHPYAQMASKAAHFLGYGEGEGEGGVTAGAVRAGAAMPKKKLQHRMKHY